MQNLKLEILHESDDLVAVNKPAGLLSVPDRFQGLPNLYNMLQDRYEKIFIVHRIDKETSGVIIFAKNEVAHKTLSTIFEQHQANKEYLALCNGVPPQPEGIIDLAIAPHPHEKGKSVISKENDAKASITRYQLLESLDRYSYILAKPLSGRQHQVRVHLAAIGCPILVDTLYGSPLPLLLSNLKKKYNLSKDGEKPLMGRVALHARSIEIQIDSEKLKIEAPLPKDFKAALTQLRKFL